MEMTKQRKMLIGVLCIGMGGLVVDRLLLSAPDEAAASQEAVIETAAPPPIQPLNGQPAPDRGQAQASASDTKTLPSYASLTERMVLAQQQADMQKTGREDPFSVPQQWEADEPKLLVNDQEATRSVNHRITNLFKLDMTVRSLNDGNEELLAVISGGGLDGVAIRVKQRVRVPNDSGPDEEYELVEVGSRYVVWESLTTNERITMKVEQDY